MKKLSELFLIVSLFWLSAIGWVGFIFIQLEKTGCKLLGFPSFFAPHVDILGVGCAGYLCFIVLSVMIKVYRRAPLVPMERWVGLLGIVMGMNLAIMLRMVLVIGKIFENTINAKNPGDVQLVFEDLSLMTWALGGTMSALLICGSFFIVLSLLKKSQ